MRISKEPKRFQIHRQPNESQVLYVADTIDICIL